MRDVLVVKVLESLQKLIHNVLAFRFADSRARSSGLGDVREQISAGAKLKKYMPEIIDMMTIPMHANETYTNFLCSSVSYISLMFGFETHVVSFTKTSGTASPLHASKSSEF